MRIKEVIELTGLTDRAIRLYIENGLVAPKNEKNYNGRNSYCFTDEDITLLQQIALLRKADFSIEQIKALYKENDESKAMLTAFFQKKREQLESDEKILSALRSVMAEPSVSVSLICERIAQNLQDKPVPETDLKYSEKDRWERIVFMILSALLALPSILIGGMVATLLLEEYPFPKLYPDPVHHVGVIGLLLPFFLMLTVFLLHLKPRLVRKKRILQRIISVFLILVSLLSIVSPIDLVAIGFTPPVYCETDDPAHYLQLGECGQNYWIPESLFPATIPQYSLPETTKYYYRHEHSFDPLFDLYAQWSLPREAYEAEKFRVQTLYPETPALQVQWGEWTCLSFTEDPLEQAAERDNYDYLIFAYNDETCTVRYIAAYSVDCGDSTDPYFISLPW